MLVLVQACPQGVKCSAQHLLQRRCISAAQDAVFFWSRGDAAFQGGNLRSHSHRVFSKLRHGMKIREYPSRQVDFNQTRERRGGADCASVWACSRGPEPERLPEIMVKCPVTNHANRRELIVSDADFDHLGQPANHGCKDREGRD